MRAPFCNQVLTGEASEAVVVSLNKRLTLNEVKNHDAHPLLNIEPGLKYAKNNHHLWS